MCWGPRISVNTEKLILLAQHAEFRVEDLEPRFEGRSLFPNHRGQAVVGARGLI